MKKPWVCALINKERRMIGMECPYGSSAVMTTNTLTPFRCALDKANPSPPGDDETLRRGQRASPEIGSSVSGDPVAVPGLPPAKLPAADPKTEKSLPKPLRSKDFVSYHAPGDARFDVPKPWRIDDRWNDSPPSAAFRLDLPRDGRQVSLKVTFCRDGRKECLDLRTAVFNETQKRRVIDKGAVMFSGRQARVLAVPGESALGYLQGKNGYYLVAYSAPNDLYARYYPAFERVLATFKGN